MDSAMPESLAVARAPMHLVKRTTAYEQTPAGPFGTRALARAQLAEAFDPS